MTRENETVKLCVENLKAILRKKLQPPLKETSINQLEDAITKILSNKEDIGKLPLLLDIKVGKKFQIQKADEKNIISADVYKVSCTCITSLDEHNQNLMEEVDAEGHTVTLNYRFYLPELFRAMYKEFPSTDKQQKGNQQKDKGSSSSNKRKQNKNAKSTTKRKRTRR